MKKQLIFTMVMLFVSVVAFAQDPEAVEASKKIDWFNLIIGGAYIIGVFVLFPIVLYTNLKEHIASSTSVNNIAAPTLSEEECNKKSQEILNKIEDQLTEYTDDNGNEMVTITNGKQSKFTKNGLDYINLHLKPTDPDIINRVNEFTEVYKERSERNFSGSYWIIGCGIAVTILMLVTAGFNTFIIIQLIGLTFYVLSSRVTHYAIDKRMRKIGGIGSGMIGGIITALFIGNDVKHYVREGGGPWKRDYETEFSNSMFGLFLLIVIALFLGFMAPLLGIFNFILNYSTNFLLPFKNEQKWYESNFLTEA